MDAMDAEALSRFFAVHVAPKIGNAMQQ